MSLWPCLSNFAPLAGALGLPRVPKEGEELLPISHSAPSAPPSLSLPLPSTFTSDFRVFPSSTHSRPSSSGHTISIQGVAWTPRPLVSFPPCALD
ncbi:hypothetical protein LY78DRAFT_83274 [Colletotrichum sublineola]|nr:hypothetical protein LY78DRAFT_83274 [Colletotrichum sublineola]